MSHGNKRIDSQIDILDVEIVGDPGCVQPGYLRLIGLLIPGTSLVDNNEYPFDCPTGIFEPPLDFHECHAIHIDVRREIITRSTAICLLPICGSWSI
jgi:hypothetical protein